MGLAAVRDLRPQLRLETPDEIGAFEQDLLAEFVLARASAGITDTTIRADVAAVVGLRECKGRARFTSKKCARAWSEIPATLAWTLRVPTI